MIQIDMPMPKMCYGCPCHDGESCMCQITGKYCFDEIPRSCPLKEVRSTDKGLIPWEDFIETKSCQFANSEPTQIACPKCGNRIYKRTDVILTCYPPKHQYFCGKCDWVGNA